MKKLTFLLITVNILLPISKLSAQELKVDPNIPSLYCVYKQQLFSEGAVVCLDKDRYLQCNAPVRPSSTVPPSGPVHMNWSRVIDKDGVCISATR